MNETYEVIVMNYLLITPWCPYPEYKNGGIHTVYNLAKNKPENVELDLFYYCDKDEVAEKALNTEFKNIYHEQLNKKKTNKRRIQSFIKGIPDIMAEFKYFDLENKIDFNKYDVVIFDQLFSLMFVPNGQYNSFFIAMMHDNLSMFYNRKSQNEDNLLRKIYDKIQSRNIINLEDKKLKHIDRILYVSKVDAEESRKTHTGYAHAIDDIKLGVEIPSDEVKSCIKTEHSMVFSGVMDYEPNEDATLYFLEKVFPVLKKKIPDLRFCIAGRSPTEKIIAAAKKYQDVEVTGFVDNMTSTITQSSIYVSPLRFGSGTKNKVLEAMAAGMPTVLSKISREGIDGLVDGENCIFVNDDSDWVDRLLLIIDDQEKQNYIGKNAREYVLNEHSWKNAFSKFIL